MEILTAAPVRDIRDALIMRSIRNDCKSYMTRHNKAVGWISQWWWYFTHYKKCNNAKSLTAWLFFYGNTPIGYGTITLEDHPLLSGGLKTEYRDKGLGKDMFSFLTNTADKLYEDRKPVKLEVLETNERAQKVYDKLGFEEIYRKNGVIYMQKVYPSQ